MGALNIVVNCTFGDLHRILLDLGFAMRTVPGSHYLFEHAATGVRLIFQPFTEGEALDQATLAVVRRNLDERGILSRSRFEDLLKERSLAG